MEKEKFSVNEINTFGWDTSLPSEVDFFGEVAKAPKEELKIIDKELELEKKRSVENVEEEVKEDVYFFEEETSKEVLEKSESKQKVDNKDNTDVEEEPSDKVSVLSYLKDKGLITLNDEDIEDLEDEDIDIYIENKWEEALDKRLEESISDLPESVKNIVRFASKGGDVEEMLSEISKPVSKGLTKKLDLALETNQEKVIKYQLEKEGYDEDYIESQIEFLKDSNRLETTAKKHFDKWNKEQELKEQDFVEKQKLTKLQQKQQQVNFKKEVTEHLLNTDTVNNLKFSEKDIKALPDYIGSTIKLEDGREITPFYKDLMESMKDKDKLIVLAKLVRNGFDFSDIEKNIETEKTRKIKDNLQRQKETKTIKSAGGSSQPKRLADMLDD